MLKCKYTKECRKSLYGIQFRAIYNMIKYRFKTTEKEIAEKIIDLIQRKEQYL